ncbi:MAG: hypothetical protein Ct9H300mP14_16780 [Gammaproteobacteria bacterium]|nr:MAG: hypothetical protein Ct9H300mP14_16780 [Gammaproteobacteria bacterium]
MNLTEPQAGSDLSAIRASAIPTDDEALSPERSENLFYLREHDLTSNIVHLVLLEHQTRPKA